MEAFAPAYAEDDDRLSQLVGPARAIELHERHRPGLPVGGQAVRKLERAKIGLELRVERHTAFGRGTPVRGSEPRRDQVLWLFNVSLTDA